MSNGTWWETPPFPVFSDIFYPCWVTNGDLVCLGHFRNGEWEVPERIAIAPSEITYYQILLPPSPPKNQKQLENNEVIYADL